MINPRFIRNPKLFRKAADRDFTEKQRENASESGAAMPDGSFPIRTESDLKNAIRLYGNSKNPAAAKAHIRTRARALGLTSHLPEEWSGTDSISAWLEKA